MAKGKKSIGWEPGPARGGCYEFHQVERMIGLVENGDGWDVIVFELVPGDGDDLRNLGGDVIEHHWRNVAWFKRVSEIQLPTVEFIPHPCF